MKRCILPQDNKDNNNKDNNNRDNKENEKKDIWWVDDLHNVQ